MGRSRSANLDDGGYKSIPKRLTTTVSRMVEEGQIVRVATGGVRSKLALVVRP